MSGVVKMQGSHFKLEWDTQKTKGNPDPPLRGKVSGFSKGARRRMIRTIAKIGDAVPIFVTLTYGADWSRDGADWKIHLHRFQKCLARYNPELSGLWRLEPQKRGAPHYHILVWGGKICKDWLATTWARCSDDESPEHISAGTRVEALRSARGAMFYCSKYMTKKVEQLPDYWENVGQHWGYHNKKGLPFAPIKSVVISDLLCAQMVSYMREGLQAYMTKKIAKEALQSEYELSEAKVIEDWVIPKEMLVGDPEKFISMFYDWAKSNALNDCLKQAMNQGNFSTNDLKKLSDRLCKSIDKEIDKLASAA